MLSYEEVKSTFDYRLDGYLIWKTESGNDKRTHRKVGAQAGVRSGPYLHVSIRSIKYTIHRLVWFWHYGYWPEYIDHINGDYLDNRIENLRECNQTQNAGNANWGELRGIEKHGLKYRVRITGTGWRKEIGSFMSLDEAINARDMAHLEYFGEFALSERSNG